MTIEVDALMAALRMGGSDAERAEITRLRNYSIQAVQDYLGDAYDSTPSVIVDESVVRLAGFLFDRPYASAGFSFANALGFSGAAAILLPYRRHTAETISPVGPSERTGGSSTGTAGGLREIGMEIVTITATSTWTETSLPVPNSDIAGILTRGPDGNETPINLFLTENLSGAAVIGASSGQGQGEYSIDTDSVGTVVFSSLVLGDHVVRLYEVQNAFG